MLRPCFTALLPLALLAAGPVPPSRQVNPFIGTAPDHGKVFPGATTPFGLVQVSPDTQTGGDLGCGYLHTHTTIQGFSFTHMSGVGWYGDLGNLLVQPTRGPLKTFYGQTDQPGSGYLSRKADEKAHAGYYAVTLQDYAIRAEMTASAHAGMLRFTFPGDPASRIQVDLARRAGGTSVRQAVKVVGPNAIEGWMRCTPEGGGWGNGDGKPNYTVYFRMEFSRPLKAFGVWEAEIPAGSDRRRETIESAAFAARIARAQVRPGVREAEADHLGFYAEFPTRQGEQVLVKAGLSFVDLDGARRNLREEIPHWDFARVQAQAEQAWDKALAVARVEGGTPAQRTAFATALYRTMIDPRAFADRDGRFPGADGKVGKAAGYTRRTIFSGWDVFRSQYPLLTIVRPDVVRDTIASLTRMARENGEDRYERWEFLNAYSGCMVGNPAISVLVDAWTKGIRDFDVKDAYEVAKNTTERLGNGERGYVPMNLSQTFEYAYTEWCLSRLAEGLGRTEDAARYAKRAGSWANLWDPREGWFNVRDKAGAFVPYGPKGRLDFSRGTVESNPYQQAFFVPHDPEGLARILGGREKAVAELQALFDKTPNLLLWNDYYNHSNEIVHTTPFLFNRWGRPDLTQKWVRTISEKAYGDGPDGLAGDEDVGQMSAWFVLASAGLHPACPGDGRYEVFTPLFDKVVLRTVKPYASGRPFTVVARNNAPGPRYIQKATLNGQPLERCWITHEELAKGGTLVLELGPEPSTWGRN